MRMFNMQSKKFNKFFGDRYCFLYFTDDEMEKKSTKSYPWGCYYHIRYILVNSGHLEKSLFYSQISEERVC